MNYSMAELRELCKKQYYSKVQKWMHYLMLYVTRPLLRTNITPDQITAFWLILQLFGSGFMVFGVYWMNVVGVVLYTVAMLLDYVDGQIARIKKISTYKGIYLEELGIYFGSPVFFLCLSIGVGRSSGDLRYLILGVVSALCILYSKLVQVNPLSYSPDKRAVLIQLRQSVSTRPANKYLGYGAFAIRRSNPLNLLLFGILFNVPHWMLFMYTPLYVLELVRKLWVQLRTLHKLDKEAGPPPQK